MAPTKTDILSQIKVLATQGVALPDTPTVPKESPDFKLIDDELAQAESYHTAIRDDGMDPRNGADKMKEFVHKARDLVASHLSGLEGGGALNGDTDPAKPGDMDGVIAK